MGLILKRLEQGAMMIAVLCVVVIMLVMSFDAVLRYVFNAPLQWSYELVGYYLMVICTYFAVSATFTSGDHVNITLVRDLMPARLVAVVDALWCLLVAAIVCVLVYGTWRNTADAWRHNEFIPGYISWPSWLSHVTIPIGCALLVARLVHHAGVLLVKGRDPAVEDHGEAME